MAVVFDRKKFAPVPFWFWNGDQSEDEITRQLELAAEGGLRGMAVHAREGNKTAYMSERWLELVRHTCREALRLGLEIWLYDEEGYPSGTVGGRLPAKGDFYQQKTLRYEWRKAADAAKDSTVVRVFRRDDLERPVNPSELPSDIEVLTFSRALPTGKWMVDYLNREVCEEFMNMTHRKYADALGEYFGSPITVVYTDDLNHMLAFGPYLSYTDKLEDEFVHEHGYSLLDNLSKIVENLPGVYRVRIDYRKTLLRMFCENFVRPMREWSRKHGMILTGHLSGDEGPLSLGVHNFTDPMPFYEFEDIPGVDDFLTGNHANSYMRDGINTLYGEINGQKGFSITSLCKPASSVASQLKNGLCSSEVLTSLGWGIPVRSQMAQIYMQLGLGVNIIVPHDCSYSTAGLTKRDHPESCFFQQPYYRWNAEIYRSANRSMQLLSRGRVDADVMVIYPASSLWVLIDGNEICEKYECIEKSRFHSAQYYTDYLSAMNLQLLRNHIDFEFGCEDIISRYGKIMGTRFIVGDASYGTVILPSLVNIGKNLLENLDRFSENGGRIIVLGDLPVLVDGVELKPCDIRWENIIRLDSWKELDNIILKPNLDFETADPSGKAEILLNTRIVDGKKEFFLLNVSGKNQLVRVSRMDYELFDPLSGRMITRDSRMPEEFMLQNLHCCHLLPRGTACAEPAEINETFFADKAESSISRLCGKWKIFFENDNNLLLDYAVDSSENEFKFGDVEYNRLEKGSMFKTVFNVPCKLSKGVVYFEPRNIADISLNGRPLDISAAKPHPATQDLRGIDVSTFLKQGENVLLFRNLEDRLEMIYFSGDFKVRLNDASAEICCDMKDETFVDLSSSGYPFYWGTVRYETEFELDSEQTEGIHVLSGDAEGVISANLNGTDLDVLFTAPWDYNISHAVRKGRNKLVLALANTAQNFFGPQRVSDISHSCLTAWRPAKKCGNGKWSFSVAPFGILSTPELLMDSFRNQG